MVEFTTPFDIANRGLQRCGAELMDPVLGFSEISKAARQVSFVYGKLRQAELRRNVWTFAVRRAPLRSIDTNTMIVRPTLWASGTSYFFGSIVDDGTGTLWSSRINNNLNNQPNAVPPSTAAWDMYFGPLTAALYNSTLGYYTGELVYTAAGDGTFNVYQSKVNGNALDPSLPNLWSSGTTYFNSQVVEAFPAWAVGTTYTPGQTVAYTDGNIYCSLVSGNVGNIPPANAAKWAAVPTLILATQQVPQTTVQTPPTTSPVIEWSVGNTYALGNFVMFNGTEYVSIANNNTGNYPTAAGSTSWAAVTGGTLYMSLFDLNINNNPAGAPIAWAVGTTYALNATVYNPTDGLIYTSKANGNIGNNPSTDNGVHWTAGAACPWTTIFTQGGGNSQWLQIGGAAFPSGVGLATPKINYPLGTGPANDSLTRNVFKLPAGFLRIANQNPGMGTMSWAGGPSGITYKDWALENGYLLTSDTGPILFRFVADFADVARMDPMFCEAFAALIGAEVCEPLTQSTAKVQSCRAGYKEWLSIAVTENAIEQGADEAPDDDFITCRA